MQKRPFLPILLVLAAGCPKKEPAAPLVGWAKEDPLLSQHECYYPPDYSTMNETDRKMARASSLDEVMKQWKGERGDGVQMREAVIDEVEITLLGRPEKIEAVIQTNLQQCKKSAAGGGTAEWSSWLSGLPSKLTAGECMQPFDYTMFDYLDIGKGWQRPMPICQDDRVRISGTGGDKYRISENGPWINVGGDTSIPTTGSSDYPCNIEGCFAGMLFGKFVADSSGIETIFVIGTETVFRAPEHGEISYRINDEVFYDNTWHKSGGIVDHTSIEISPAE